MGVAEVDPDDELDMVKAEDVADVDEDVVEVAVLLVDPGGVINAG